MFHLVFHEPQIPLNTGSALRLAACTGATLHIAGPANFDLDDRRMRRAGLDYADLATLRVHADLDAALASVPAAPVYAFTTRAAVPFTSVDYRPGDVLLFGPEPTGLDEQALAHPRITEQVWIPMLPERRSLNLANSAAIALYEAWRQCGFDGARAPGPDRTR